MPKSAEAKGPEDDDVPEITPGLLYVQAWILSVLEISSRKKGEALLNAMAVNLALCVSLSSVVPIRPSSDLGKRRRCERQAAAMFNQQLPTFIAKLPPE